MKRRKLKKFCFVCVRNTLMKCFVISITKAIFTNMNIKSMTDTSLFSIYVLVSPFDWSLFTLFWIHFSVCSFIEWSILIHGLLNLYIFISFPLTNIHVGRRFNYCFVVQLEQTNFTEDTHTRTHMIKTQKCADETLLQSMAIQLLKIFTFASHVFIFPMLVIHFPYHLNHSLYSLSLIMSTLTQWSEAPIISYSFSHSKRIERVSAGKMERNSIK